MLRFLVTYLGSCIYLFYGIATRTFFLLQHYAAVFFFFLIPRLQSTAEVISHKNIFTCPLKMCKAAKPLPIELESLENEKINSFFYSLRGCLSLIRLRCKIPLMQGRNSLAVNGTKSHIQTLGRGFQCSNIILIFRIPSLSVQKAMSIVYQGKKRRKGN